jgi:hypothetical protein
MFEILTHHPWWTAVVIVPALLAASACAAVHYRTHPGALNKADSAAYDTLLVAEAAIEGARVDLENGNLPDKAKDTLNRLIESYNLARQSWLAYRAAVTTNLPAQIYFDRLTQRIAGLTETIRAFEEAK